MKTAETITIGIPITVVIILQGILIWNEDKWNIRTSITKKIQKNKTRKREEKIKKQLLSGKISLCEANQYGFDVDGFCRCCNTEYS